MVGKREELIRHVRCFFFHFFIIHILLFNYYHLVINILFLRIENAYRYKITVLII